MNPMNQSDSRLNRRRFLQGVAQAAAAVPFAAFADGSASGRASRISYFCNGEIHVNTPGQPEGKPLTTGHMDFKPSWSKTGNHLVCFRRTKDDPITVNWKSAVFIINADGSGFHQLSDGTRTDFNPTWSREGLNTPLWNRKNSQNGGFHVVQSKVGHEPGQEIAVTEETHHTWVHSGLTDGRMLVNAAHPTLGWGVFLLTQRDKTKPFFERIQWELDATGQMHRASISPSGRKICFEFLKGSKFIEPGHTLYLGDFDAQERRITNLRAFANPEGKAVWFAYPRWINGESGIIYHSGQTGKNQLYVYQLEDGSTRRVSTNPRADYRYPHGEAAPC